MTMLQTGELSSSDSRATLDVLTTFGEASETGAAFARHGVTALQRLANFYDDPLVRQHGRSPAALTLRINDVVPAQQFQRTPLFNDYYRSIRVDHAMAVPIHVDRNLLVSFVFNRSEHDFSDRERVCMELIRPHLGNFYRLTRALDSARSAPIEHNASAPALRLSAREREVMHWLSGGKTDRDIGDILGISPRTVHKHLQRIYEKLGVETRTAAVMRFLGRRN
jgi:DNA-binding CsgD family transcriptional regulator